MNRSGVLALGLLGLLVFAACATSNPSPPPDSGHRARCLSDPQQADMRPLVIFFCVESP